MDKKELNSTARVERMNVSEKKPVEGKPSESQRLSYEQLNDACMQLYQQNQELIKRLQQADASNMFRRLDYLFEVIRNSSVFREDFVKNCVSEIEDAITLKEEETKKEEA